MSARLNVAILRPAYAIRKENEELKDYLERRAAVAECLKDPVVAKAFYKGGPNDASIMRLSQVPDPVKLDLIDFRNALLGRDVNNNDKSVNPLNFALVNVSKAGLINGELVEGINGIAAEMKQSKSTDHEKFVDAKTFIRLREQKNSFSTHDNVRILVDDAMSSVAILKLAGVSFTSDELLPVNDLASMQRLNVNATCQDIPGLARHAQKTLAYLDPANRAAMSPSEAKAKADAKTALVNHAIDTMSVDKFSTSRKDIRANILQREREKLTTTKDFQQAKINAVALRFPSADISKDDFAKVSQRWFDWHHKTSMKNAPPDVIVEKKHTLVNLNSNAYVDDLVKSLYTPSAHILAQQNTSVSLEDWTMGENIGSFADSKSIAHKELMKYDGDDQLLLACKDVLASAKTYQKFDEEINDLKKVDNAPFPTLIEFNKQISGRAGSPENAGLNTLGLTKLQQGMLKVDKDHVAVTVDLSNADARILCYLCQNEELAKYAADPDIDFYLANGVILGFANEEILKELEIAPAQEGRSKEDVIKELTAKHRTLNNMPSEQMSDSQKAQKSTLNDLRKSCKVGTLASGYGMGKDRIAKQYCDGDLDKAGVIYDSIKNNRSDITKLHDFFTEQVLDGALKTDVSTLDASSTKPQMVAYLDWNTRDGLKLASTQEYEQMQKANPKQYTTVFTTRLEKANNDENSNERNLIIGMPNGFNIRLDNLRNEQSPTGFNKYVYHNKDKKLDSVVFGGTMSAWVAQHYVGETVNTMRNSLHHEGIPVPSGVHDDVRLVVKDDLDVLNKVTQTIEENIGLPANLRIELENDGIQFFDKIISKNSVEINVGPDLAAKIPLQRHLEALAPKQELVNKNDYSQTINQQLAQRMESTPAQSPSI